MPDSQDSRSDRHFLFSVDLDRMLLRKDICHLSMESKISAKLDDPVSHGLDHVCQDIRSDVRLLFVKDFLRSAE